MRSENVKKGKSITLKFLSPTTLKYRSAPTPPHPHNLSFFISNLNPLKPLRISGNVCYIHQVRVDVITIYPTNLFHNLPSPDHLHRLQCSLESECKATIATKHLSILQISRSLRFCLYQFKV